MVWLLPRPLFSAISGSGSPVFDVVRNIKYNMGAVPEVESQRSLPLELPPILAVSSLLSE